MSLPDAVVRWVKRYFGGDVIPALAMLESAVHVAGKLVAPRLVRCAAVG